MQKVVEVTGEIVAEVFIFVMAAFLASGGACGMSKGACGSGKATVQATQAPRP